jgi:hypothetical protein
LPVTVAVGETYLLATLVLQNVTEAVPPSLAAGDTFEISVLKDESGFFGDPGLQWDFTPGKVESIPEPSTWGLLAAGMAILVGTSYRRRYFLRRVKLT